MTLIISPNSPKFKSIVLQTRLGNPIENRQFDTIPLFEQTNFSILEARYSNVEFRTEPSPIYNCHGFTFAAKRTGIEETQELLKILQEDNYKEIPLNQVLPGDIILYFAYDGDIEHSGIVISKPEEPFNLPKVISKWGSFKEAIHYANMCPYNFSNAKYFRILR